MAAIRAERASKLQGAVRSLIESLVARDFELGVQVSIYLDGEEIVDVQAGRVEPYSDVAVAPDSVFPVCSTTKGVVSAIAHVLAERGLLDYGKRLADYWPEFAANGKDSISVRQALSHEAGLSQTPPFSSFEEALDFDSACSCVASKMAPAWTPGSKMEYHSRSFGWIVGGLLQRVGGRPFKKLLAEEITGPLGLERELFIGIDDDGDKRFSAFVSQPTQKEQCTTAANTYAKPPPGTVAEFVMPLNEFVNMPAVRRSVMPALNGIMSARAIAKLYASLIGEVDGVRLIPASRLEIATTPVNKPGAAPICFGHGFGLGWCLKGPASYPGEFFGHGGAGGSEGMGNKRLKLAVGLTKNRMDTHYAAPDHTNRLLMRLIADTLGEPIDGGFYK